jgi:hypothetical protein
MNRAMLLDRLDKATDRAVSFAITRGDPIRVSKKSTLIGNTFVEKNAAGLYDVVLPNRVKLFGDISVFDVAIIVAQKYNNGESSAIKKILAKEEIFVKHHNDMIHYLNCLKSAKKRHDIERMAILEDKFQVAEILARGARNSISIFKRVK